MSFNGSGSFVINSSGQPVVANTLIQAAVMNALTADLATGLSTCITKDGQTTVTANIPMGGYVHTGLGAGAANGQSLRYEQLFSTSAVTLLGAMNWVKGADIASATTTNLTNATGNGVHITGTTTITAVTLGSGMWRLVVFDGILTLTHHATNNNLPGGANITTAAGDRALYWADGTTVYCAFYMPAAGTVGKGAVTGSGLTMATSRVLGRTTASTGAIEELTVTAPIALSAGTITTSMATSRLIGRTTASTGVMEEISVAGNLTLSGGSLTGSIGTLSTMQASTSGTAITFGSLPAGIKRITMMLSGVSTNGTDALLCRLGDSGGIEDASYVSQVVGVANASTGNAASSTAGLILNTASVASQVIHGVIVWTLMDSATNLWAAHAHVSDSGGVLWNSTAYKALSGTLTQINLTTAAASNTFDAGNVNILYEI